jgi:L-threonylcarbamoyladenylate synthase
LVAIPTETVYGLAASALDPKACARIFRAKRRPADDPLIVHVSDLRAAEKLAAWNPPARALAAAFWPGPLTIVLPKHDVVPAIVTSGQATVALRSPAHPLARKLLRLAGIPLAAPSANPFGYVSPTTAQHVLDGLGGRIGHVLDGGPCTIGVESTIVDASDARRLTVLRPGAIGVAHLRRVLRDAGLRATVVQRGKKRGTVLAPGLLDQHYSPRTSFGLVRVHRRTREAGETGRIYWRKPARAGKADYWFSETGDANDAARNLYAVLRSADAKGHTRILCERAPASAGSLGAAINDRLARAAGKP